MPVRTACIHKRRSVTLAVCGNQHRCVVSHDPATCNKNGLTHTMRNNPTLRVLSKCAVGGVALPLTRGLRDA